MPVSFEKQLARVQGKIHRVNMWNDFERYRDGLLYYWNRAERLHDSAQMISDANGPREVFALLAGLSIEVLLKGICRAFDKPIPHLHGLTDLCREVGIPIGDDDRIILDALSEYIKWASRYPTPRRPEQMESAMAIFRKQRRRAGSLATLFIPERDIDRNYNRLWGMFATYYHKAREARLESAELRF